MNAQSSPMQDRRVSSAGAVFPWCVTAGLLVAALLLYHPPDKRGIAFWDVDGALRLLADLMLFYSLFILPLFLTRRRSFGEKAEPAAVVLFTGAVGLVMLNCVADLGTATLSGIIGFIVLVSVGGLVWARVLEERPAIYYPVAVLAGFGLPTAGLFCEELFAMRAVWLEVLSPFTAWRLLVAKSAASWGAWVVLGLVLVSGCVLAVRRKRGGPG